MVLRDLLEFGQSLDEFGCVDDGDQDEDWRWVAGSLVRWFHLVDQKRSCLRA